MGEVGGSENDRGVEAGNLVVEEAGAKKEVGAWVPSLGDSFLGGDNVFGEEYEFGDYHLSWVYKEDEQAIFD